MASPSARREIICSLRDRFKAAKRAAQEAKARGEIKKHRLDGKNFDDFKICKNGDCYFLRDRKTGSRLRCVSPVVYKSTIADY